MAAIVHAPAEGHWVIIQPWEFGSVPASWVGPMSTVVDEVWAYSGFVSAIVISRAASPPTG